MASFPSFCSEMKTEEEYTDESNVNAGVFWRNILETPSGIFECQKVQSKFLLTWWNKIVHVLFPHFLILLKKLINHFYVANGKTVISILSVNADADADARCENISTDFMFLGLFCPFPVLLLTLDDAHFRFTRHCVLYPVVSLGSGSVRTRVCRSIIWSDCWQTSPPSGCLHQFAICHWFHSSMFCFTRRYAE